MFGILNCIAFRVEVEESFSVNFTSGHTLHAGPPPGSGLILAYILRILDGKLPAPNAGLDAHRLVEAFKFGYGERSRLGDHKFVDINEVRKIVLVITVIILLIGCIIHYRFTIKSNRMIL